MAPGSFAVRVMVTPREETRFTRVSPLSSNDSAVPIVRPSPYEPADSLPATRVGAVSSDAGAPARRSRPGIRWAVALIVGHLVWGQKF